MKKAPAFHRRLRRRQNFSPHQPVSVGGAKWPISAMVVGQAPFAPPNVRPWVTPLGGGGAHLQTRGEKMEIFLHVFGAEGAENVFFLRRQRRR